MVNLMGESNTVVSAYTLYRHLQQYCSHPPTSDRRMIDATKTIISLFGNTINAITLYSIDTHLMHQQKTTIENVGKEKIARNEQFLLFSQCFLLNQIIVSPFVHIFDIISLFAAEFEEPKIGIPGKGLDKSRQCDRNE